MSEVTYNPPAFGSQAWLDAIDYPERLREEVKRNRLKAVQVPPEPGFGSQAWLDARKGALERSTLTGPRGGRYRYVVNKKGNVYRQYF